MHEFVQTSVFSRRSGRLSFSHCAQHFLVNFRKVHVCVQNSVFIPRSARFVNSALGASLYSDYQQSARVCTKQSFKPDFGTFSHCRPGHTTFERFSAKCNGLAQISTFCHFSTRHTTFEPFSAKCTSLWKTAFSARDQDVSPFSHWVHYFLAIFSKIHEFVQNSVSSAR